MSEPVEIVRIPFHSTEVLAIDEAGQPRIVLRPVIEGLGVSYSSQLNRLKGKSWACVSTINTQLPGDTQSRPHVVIDVRTLLMLLATLDENRVAERARDLLVAYQREVSDVIESYWTKGAAVQPGVEVGPQHEVPQTFAQALRLAAEQLERAEAAERQVVELEVVKTEQSKELATTRPKAVLVDTFYNPTGDATTIGTLAKQLGLKEQVLRDYLVARKVIYRRVLGRRYSRSKGREAIEYQWLPRSGFEPWFTIKDHPEVDRLYNNQVATTLYVNPVGKARIAELLRRHPISDPPKGGVA